MFSNISENLHIKWGSLCIMDANVCALSLFLTRGPYAPLPAWAGENSPECLMLLNKRHEDARQVLHARVNLCFLFHFLSRLWFRVWRWSVAAAASIFFCCFHALRLPAVTGDTAPSAQTEGRVLRSVNQRTSTTATCTPPPKTHTAANTQHRRCSQSGVEAKYWQEK